MDTDGKTRPDLREAFCHAERVTGPEGRIEVEIRQEGGHLESSFFVKVQCGDVVGGDLQSDRSDAEGLRVLLSRLKQPPADPASLETGIDIQRFDSGHPRTLSIQDNDESAYPKAGGFYETAAVGLGQEIAELTGGIREDLPEAFFFELNDSAEIFRTCTADDPWFISAANHMRCGQRGSPITDI